MSTRFVLLWILLFGWSGFTHAQITFGLKAGINQANWSTEGNNPLTAVHAGGSVKIPFGEKFSAQPEILYSGKGSDLANFIPNTPMRFTTNYLSLPVMLGYTVKHVTFKFGPEISYLVKSRIEVNSVEQNIPEAFEDWDWALAAGATLQIFDGLSLEVRYLYGMQDVAELFFVDQNGNALGKLDEAKNRAWQFGLCYMFL